LQICAKKTTLPARPKRERERERERERNRTSTREVSYCKSRISRHI
jgi:hypothetical protein